MGYARCKFRNSLYNLGDEKLAKMGTKKADHESLEEKPLWRRVFNGVILGGEWLGGAPGYYGRSNHIDTHL
jgi:hypothetical protein